MKLTVTSSPHIRGDFRTSRLMLDVVIALLPALIGSVYFFGFRALLVTLVSVAAAVGFEWLWCRLMKQDNKTYDLSAVVTGVLLAFVCPPTIPYWMIIIGDLFAIILVKMLFGGIGKNFVNPALAGRAFLVGSYAGVMTTWIDPAAGKAPLMGSTADIVTAATPMAYLKVGDMEGLVSQYSVSDMFIGMCGGSMGEVSALALLVGGAYLIYRKVIGWQIPVAYIGTVAVLSFLFPKAGTGLEWMLYSVFGGGLFLGAFFMATDYATAPVTKKGQLIFGIGCGLFTVLIRYFGSYNEGVCYSIMVMNLLVPLIEKYTKPTRFGVVKSDKKEAAAK